MTSTIGKAIEARLASEDVDGALAIFADTWAIAFEAEGIEAVRAAAAGFSPEMFLRSDEALAARVLMFTIEGDEDNRIVETLREYLLNRHAENQRTSSAARGDENAAQSATGATDDAALNLRLRLVTAAAVISVTLGHGDVAEACQVADAVISELETDAELAAAVDESPAGSRALSWFRSKTGQAYMAAGRMAAAQEQLAALEAVPHARAGGGTRNEFVATSMLAIKYAITEPREHVEALIDRAEALGVAGGWYTGPNMIMILTAKELIQTTHLEVAQSIATRALLEAEIGDDPFWSLATAHVRSEVSRLSGDSEQALATVRYVLHGFSLEESVPLVVGSLRYAQAALHLALGRPGAAIRDMDDLVPDEEHTACYASRAATGWIALGRPRIALKLTDDCLALGATHNRRTWVQVLAVRAAAMLAIGNTEKLLELLREMFGLVGDYGGEALTLLPPSVLDQLAEVAEAGSIPVPPMMRTARALASARLEDVFNTVGRLTRSQRTLLGELAGDATLEEIAERTFAALNTVKSHSRSLYLKLGARSRQQAVDIASQAGFYEVIGRDSA